MIKYTSCYDRVFTCLHNSSVRLIRHFFLIPLRWRIREILLYLDLSVAAPCVLYNRQNWSTPLVSRMGETTLPPIRPASLGNMPRNPSSADIFYW